MYGDARMAKLKELKRMLMELALEDADGTIKADELQSLLDEAGDVASEEGAVEGDEEATDSPETVEEVAAEDPLAEARRRFFKPKAPERRGGTAMMLASVDQKPKAAFESKKAKGKLP